MKIEVYADRGRELMTLRPEAGEDWEILKRLYGPHQDTQVLLRPVTCVGGADGESVQILTYEVVKIEPDDLK